MIGDKSYIYLSNSTDCYENLVLEELILRTNPFPGDVILLYQNSNTVVVGRNQNLYEEVNLDLAKKFAVSIFRRLSGGGAVYQDLGNLNFSFISTTNQSYENFSLPIVNFLRKLGEIDVRFEGRNDILVNGAKVSGSAQYIIDNRVVHHGTLLYDVDFKRLAEVLRPNKLKLESKGIKSIRQRITNIKQELAENAPKNANLLAKKLVEFFKKEGAKIIEESDIEKLKNEGLFKELLAKRKSYEWIFGKNPKFSFNYHARFLGGYIRVGLEINKNKIAGLAISGDFLATKPINLLVEKLIGINYSQSHIQQTLEGVNLSQYLGTISIQEFISVLLGNTESMIN